ncbi:hypothetical protein SmJEL517_g00320 [Synchytrium microbalum]|uniref:Uncharacterized protein n=1 Tax=Synchytrium microbalum TaxID=1806994 RepID=A0A507CGJ1_9FUNG|nr:uncharacterized protein SmJEL517_g00320 [Synchytrium microbalum]TPX38339.1 hypothetical protein SmJEL517_g00320 [Synchytrium microbalum]
MMVGSTNSSASWGATQGTTTAAEQAQIRQDAASFREDVKNYRRPSTMLLSDYNFLQLRAGRIVCVTHHLPYTCHVAPESTSGTNQSRTSSSNGSHVLVNPNTVPSSQSIAQLSLLNRTVSSSSLHRMVPYAPIATVATLPSQTSAAVTGVGPPRPHPLNIIVSGSSPTPSRNGSASPSASSANIYKQVLAQQYANMNRSYSSSAPNVNASAVTYNADSSDSDEGGLLVDDDDADIDSDDDGRGAVSRSMLSATASPRTTTAASYSSTTTRSIQNPASVAYGQPSPNPSPPSSPLVQSPKTMPALISTSLPPSMMLPSPNRTSNNSNGASNNSSNTTSDVQWNLKSRRGHSALYSGIRSLTDRGDEVVHIGWVGVMTDARGNELPSSKVTSEQQAQLSDILWDSKKCLPVFLDDKAATNHYEGYCKTELWPLFHYILWETVVNGNATQESKHWADYVIVNQKFADAVIAAYEPNDIIWVHDYHLLLVPAMLRKALPQATIGFFLHTPFPSSEIFRCLPRRKEMLQGVLGANLIGFQTYSYARHFISTCTRVLGLESSPKGVEYKGMLVTVATFPIGIDIHRVEARRKMASVQDKMAIIRDMYAGKKIIIGRDKLDHIKGIQHKLNAFERFMIMYPEFLGKVVLIQVTTPPQREQPKLEAKVSELVSRINGTFGSLEFSPVHHFHQHLDQDEYFALLSVADTALITSVRDGMNTTSHEFVACQQENLGPLILSEFTGTAGSLSAAMLVNPWDYVGVANAIHEALTMSQEEKFNKQQQLYDHVVNHTALFWAASFVSQLREVTRIPMQSKSTPILDEAKLLSKCQAATQRLLMFDYDGTLTPIVKLPTAAFPPPEMLQSLETLARDPNNVVYIISGRDQATMDQWLGHIPGLGLSAEHGCFIKHPATSTESTNWINVAADIDMGWMTDVQDIFEYYTERTPASFVERKRAAITWHYRMADPEFGTFQCNECRNHLENAILSKLPVEILVGKKTLEVRPISINKGEIVKRLVLANPNVDFILCVGDDKTDEDMFKVLRRQSTANILQPPRPSTSSSYSTTISPTTGLGVTNPKISPTMTAADQNNSDMNMTQSPVTLPADSPPTGPVYQPSPAVPTMSSPPYTHSISNPGFNINEDSSPTSLNSAPTPAWIGATAAIENEGLFTVTIGHGSKLTAADWHVAAPENVITLLGKMAALDTHVDEDEHIVF